MTTLRLPANGWRPRDYQMRTWGALERGAKRVVSVWHRRAGKDELALHWSACSAFKRGATYWHMLPQAAQARKAIWSAVNPHTGVRRIDEAFPPAVRATTRENEMQIEFINGATWQVVGSDNYNSLVGSPPVGVTFSEFALADPNAWTYIRPIIAENNGWALFIYTPRGRNHAAKFFEDALKDPLWYAEKLTAHQTGVFTPDQLAQELRELKRDLGEVEGLARFRQEYECDFSASVPGSYFGFEMSAAERQGRIGSYMPLPSLPVHTAWDLGFGDDTAIWCFQIEPDTLRYRMLRFIHGSGVGLSHYVEQLRAWGAAHGITWGSHLWPHDGGRGDLSTGETLVQTARKLGLGNVIVLDRPTEIESGINAARQLLPLSLFDADGCEYGVSALQNYARAWDDERKVFKSRPEHDWASHPADAFRVLATGRHRLRSAFGKSAAPKQIVYPSHMGTV